MKQLGTEISVKFYRRNERMEDDTPIGAVGAVGVVGDMMGLNLNQYAIQAARKAEHHDTYTHYREIGDAVRMLCQLYDRPIGGGGFESGITGEVYRLCLNKILKHAAALKITESSL